MKIAKYAGILIIILILSTILYLYFTTSTSPIKKHIFEKKVRLEAERIIGPGEDIKITTGVDTSYSHGTVGVPMIAEAEKYQTFTEARLKSGPRYLIYANSGWRGYGDGKLTEITSFEFTLFMEDNILVTEDNIILTEEDYILGEDSKTVKEVKEFIENNTILKDVRFKGMSKEPEFIYFETDEFNIAAHPFISSISPSFNRITISINPKEIIHR